jgi:hypothetical protein
MPIAEFSLLLQRWHSGARPISTDQLPDSVLAPLEMRG